jgi:CRP-like cAMP-binding protein
MNKPPKTNALSNFFRILRGRELQFRAVVITALSSYVLQISAILLHWHFWAIALVTILPWIPLFSMKVLWSSRHYGFMAIYLTLMIVQGGHVVEHVFQMGEYMVYRPVDESLVGTAVNFLPDTPENKSLRPVLNQDGGAIIGRAVTQPEISRDLQLRQRSDGSFYVVRNVGCRGWSWNGAGCASAHGVFGELDRELVHFVWDGVILLACALLWLKYPLNPWTFWAFFASFIHQVEHIYLFYTSLAPDVTGYPNVGNFFGITVMKVDAGFLGRNGVLGSWVGLESFLNAVMLPNRINLHFIYNTLVFLPMVLAFRYQLRQIYDEWLAKALPNLSREQLIQFSTESQYERFSAGTVIFNQGDAADKFYIITKGQIEIIRAAKRGGEQQTVAVLGEGSYFGEVGILGRTSRTATVKAITLVETLALDEATFRAMVAQSAESHRDLDFVVRDRIKRLGVAHGKNLEKKVQENPDLLVKSRIIQTWLDDMEYKSQLLNWQSLSEPVAVPASAPVPATVAAPVNVPIGAVRPSGAYTAIASSSMQKPPYLRVRSGESAGERFELSVPRLIIGRKSTRNSDLPVFQVDDPRVSREHIEVIRQIDGFYYVRDNGSANGSWLNGVTLEGNPVRLKEGDEIRMGPDTAFTFHTN